MLKSLIYVWEYLPFIGSFFSDEFPYTFSSPHQKGEHMDLGQKVHTPPVSLIPGGEGSDTRTWSTFPLVSSKLFTDFGIWVLTPLLVATLTAT